MSYLYKHFRKKKTLLQVLQGKRKRRPLSEYKRAMACLDTVFHATIRLRDARKYRGICPICGKNRISVCFHFVPRGFLALRWEPDAACGSCAPCNGGEMLNRGRTTIYRDAWVRIVGEKRVLELESIQRHPFKKSAAELRDIIRYFTVKLEQGADHA